MNKFAMIAVLSFTCCVTTEEKKQNTYKFPNAFKSEQMVRVFDGSKEFSVIGTVERTGNDYTFEFAEPFLMTKLVTAKVKNSQSEIQWNTGYQPSQFDAQRVVDTLVKLYQGESTEATNGMYQFETSPVKFELTSLEGPETCKFPSRIKATSPLKDTAWITFDTKSAGCL